LAERDVPLELESELLVLSGSFVLGADEDVVEEKLKTEMTKPLETFVRRQEV
jgi:hypothetical protein